MTGEQSECQRCVDIAGFASLTCAHHPEPTPLDLDELERLLAKAGTPDWPELAMRLLAAAPALVERARAADTAEREIDSYAVLTKRQSDLLTGVAAALNGPPPALVMWSHHDLPEKAQALRGQVAALSAAIVDLCWRAQRYGETDDGDTAFYLLTKGTVHRLIGAAQCVGIPAAFRVSDQPESLGGEQ